MYMNSPWEMGNKKWDSVKGVRIYIDLIKYFLDNWSEEWRYIEKQGCGSQEKKIDSVDSFSCMLEA